MDLVELVLHLEDAFEVKISDAEATTMETPRHVIDFLYSHPSISSRFTKGEVTEKVWDIIECELGVDRAKFNEDSGFVKDMYSGSLFHF